MRSLRKFQWLKGRGKLSQSWHGTQAHVSFWSELSSKGVSVFSWKRRKRADTSFQARISGTADRFLQNGAWNGMWGSVMRPRGSAQSQASGLEMLGEPAAGPLASQESAFLVDRHLVRSPSWCWYLVTFSWSKNSHSANTLHNMCRIKTWKEQMTPGEGAQT